MRCWEQVLRGGESDKGRKIDVGSWFDVCGERGINASYKQKLFNSSSCVHIFTYLHHP